MNVLIVDDMKSVVDGMEKGINWKHIGVHEVYKAYNAAEAKVLLNNLHIDLLMTDVEMPGESGLDLVSWVREQNMDMECFILSSHPNFDYARRAMSLNSFNYILLPCSYFEIESAILKVVQSIEKKRQEEELLKYGKLVNEPWLDTVLFERCLDASANLEMSKKLEELYHMEPKQSGYLCLLSADEQGEIVEGSEANLLHFLLHNILKEIMRPLRRKLFLFQKDKTHYIFFVYSEIGEIGEESAFAAQIQMMENGIRNALQLDTTIVFQKCMHLGELPAKYQQLISQKEQKERPVRELLQETDDGQIVSLIREYVHNHIGQEIKRSDLADLVHLNIDYLSRIFKRDTGMTLNDYIVNEKIKVARDLLRTTSLPVYLVATKVGYSNFSYFSKLYKKKYGIAPLEERRS